MYDAFLDTLHTRVESWECDFNGHWNARFYGRAFQMAAEAVATRATGRNPGGAVIVARHIRFHSELRIGAAVEVRSARLDSGDHAGAVVHCLLGDGRLAATSLDLSAAGAEGLVATDAGTVAAALPRSLPWRERLAPGGIAKTVHVAETGPVRPSELDHTGALLFEDIIRRVAMSSHGLVARLGFTSAYAESSGTNRMLVEARIEPAGHVAPGALLRVISHIGGVSAKSFMTEHRLETQEGQTVARLEHALLTVDLKARRAIETPPFLRDLAS